MIYDRFQQEAINYIDQRHSVIVSAPTGAGKTVIAEYIIDNAIVKNTGVIYTAPIKALSNQKFRDFQAKFQDNIGILTGDVSINPGAPVLIMTTEIFRNKILDDPESLKAYSWVIFDEIHYIDNFERGTVWEESIIFLPEHMRILGLSATIPNITQLADWIESIHKKPVRRVIENNRPVPLEFFFQCQDKIFNSLSQLNDLHAGTPNKLHTLIKHIQQKNGFPLIYFVFGRRRAEDLAQDLYGHDFLNPEEKKQINAIYDDLCRRFELKGEKSASLLYPLINKGIAYHHAGMLPTLKETVERLFTSRLLKVIFTTETFALGINMPSRSVIFDELRKYYGNYIRPLKVRDFFQMAGRAGRRGIDKKGWVYCRVNRRRITTEQAGRVIYGSPEEVRSQLNTSYATILNLYEKYHDGLFNIYPKSLHYFQSRKHEQKQALEALGNKLKLLKSNGYIESDSLTQKGFFAKTVYGYELFLSELYEQDILEQLDEFGLGIIAAAAVFEPRKNQRSFKLSRPARKLRHISEEIYAGIKSTEIKHRIYSTSKQPYFNLAPAMEAWLRGTSFDKIIQFTDTDEGEVVRYFRMSIQVLKEIRDGTAASEVLKEKIKETVRVINRDIVDAEKQLRES